jgi:hypothetical protein
MVGVFGPSVDKHFERAQGPTGQMLSRTPPQGPNGNETANETGESSATANDPPHRQDASAQPPQQSMSV